nr:protein kinase [Antrihabitans stalactiti]
MEPGSTFAGYTIERRLGSGGMGSVYLARHPRLPRMEALKLLNSEHSSSTMSRTRFEREADLAARLHHPNIVAVHDRGVEGDQLWIAMQYIEGTDVAGLVAAGTNVLSPGRAVAIVHGAAKGLDHAHRFGMLHRDVKPANILVTAAPDEDSGERALISDFGIARSMEETRQLTIAGEVIATIAYAAPEQLQGHAVDHRADIYALGATLYEMLTGFHPYPRKNMIAVVTAHLEEPPPRVTTVRPQLPPEIDAVIARALAKNPQHRYDSCRDLAIAAARALSIQLPTNNRADPPPQTQRRMVHRQPTPPPRPTLPPPRPTPPPQPTRPPQQPPAPTTPPAKSRRPMWIAIAAAAVLVFIVGGVAFAMRSSSDSSTAAATSTTRAATKSSAPSTTTVAVEPAAAFTKTSIQVKGTTPNNSTYDVDLPQIEGANAAVTKEFNESIRAALQDQIDSNADQVFTLTGADSEVSHIGEHVVGGLLLTSWNAVPPGAHPSALVATVVIDTDNAQPITLDVLFADKAAGLRKLSTEAATLLPTTDAGADYFTGGIEPTEANFANWLPTPSGMEIHFTDGQVGPHAVGLIVVTIPWENLSDVLAPGIEQVVSS